MTGGSMTPPTDSSWQSLDAALSEALRPPALPPGFRSRLTAEMARSREPAGLRTVVARLEREHRECLAQLDARYLRMRRRTWAAMVGMVSAAAAGTFALLPILTELFGPAGPLVLTALGGLVGFSTSTKIWGGVPQG